jgi:hypothetical protein
MTQASVSPVSSLLEWKLWFEWEAFLALYRRDFADYFRCMKGVAAYSGRS